MDDGGPSRKKWKPAGVESTDEAPEPVETEAPDPRVGEEDDDSVDRISSLPDAVLGDIISLLPIDEGARIQILASKWRHLWLSAPLNLDYTHLLNRYGCERAAGIVPRILSSHPGPGRRLLVNGCYFGRGVAPVDDWLRSGALDRLQDLELGFYSREVPLPSHTFRFAPTLRVDTIKKCNLPDGTVQGLQFPLLKQLGLDDVGISECSFYSLIASCPALECLLIRKSIGFRCIRINSLTLSLRSFGVINCSSYPNRVLLEELIIENAPCLKKLLHVHFDIGLHLHVSVVSAPQLETIGYLSDNQDSLCRLVFGSTIIQGLHVDNLAMVVRTVKTLAVKMKTLSLDTVIQLMTCFPCLEKLYIQASKSKPNNLWRRKHRNLTRCLDVRLKRIVFNSYRGIQSQVNFVTFFVLNARLLELVMLQVRSIEEPSKEFVAEECRKLQLEKRASIGARIRFASHKCVRDPWDIRHIRDLDLVDLFSLEC